MTLVAQHVDVRHVQQARILRAVRTVARRASFRLDRGMLVNERPTHIRVALGADLVLIGRGPQVIVPEGTVHVVAVAALDQPLIHPVMERHAERRLYVTVALIAERRLRGLEQVLRRLAVVNAVTACATDTGLAVRRTQEIGMRTRVAGEALGIDLLRRSGGKVEDLGLVTASLNVRLARSVAVLAGDAFVAMHQNHLGVRIVGKTVCFLLVAGGAYLGADIIGRSRHGCFGLCPGWLLCRWTGQRRGAYHACAQQ